MDKATFWQLIKTSVERQPGDAVEQSKILTSALAELSEADILDFDRYLNAEINRTRTRTLEAASYIILGERTPTDFEKFSIWLVGRGEEILDAAIENPESLAEIADPCADGRPLLYAAPLAYRERTGKEFPFPDRNRPEFSGETWEPTPEYLSRLLPQLFQEYWKAQEAALTEFSRKFAFVAARMRKMRGDNAPQSEADSLYIRAVLAPEAKAHSPETAELLRRAAEMGHSEAQYLYGSVLQLGAGVRRDYKAAMEWFRKAADQKQVDALASIGVLYQEGMGVTRNHEEAARWFRRGVEAGSPEAEFGLGVLFSEGLGVPRDINEAIRWYKRAAQSGHSTAANNLGIIYSKGDGVPMDDKEAVKWFSQSAKEGLSEGLYHLGFMHQEGRGVERDLIHAAVLYQEAVEQGNLDAMGNLGMLYGNGQGVPKDFERAAELFRSGADAGHLPCTVNLATCYQNGRGVKQDIAEAVRLYEHAADAGNEFALFNLGTLYQRGIGVAKDPKSAVHYYQLAADLGMPAALNNLADCFENGFGVSQDMAKAARLYREAALKGVPIAQLSLGQFLLEGRGVERDAAEAVKWLTLAADNGLDKAQEILDSLEGAPAPRARPDKNAAPRGSRSRNRDGASIIQRAFGLRMMLWRNEFEKQIAAKFFGKGALIKESTVEIEAMTEQLKQQELWQAISEGEQLYWQAVPGEWDKALRLYVDHSVESIGLLLWAGGIIPALPDYQTPFDLASLDKTYALSTDVNALASRAQARSPEELTNAREVAWLWRWRVEMTRALKSPGNYDMSSADVKAGIADMAGKAQAAGVFTPVADDFPYKGRPFRSISSEEWVTTFTIADERLRSLTWLVDLRMDWDEVVTEFDNQDDE